ncbi:MaoC/PaaZ C-terminal domain-containing protein [Halorientalis sp.]|jgi:acyl dehydratase|uniref:MaoC/PaaZ C-terminal domain-containing protein n=1 Tax=Halorientalis sp. TaxID=1931229 RepID=UPI00261924D6|nr:MaoC/PaaZ C-terminal domain-containing protein [Halorientalis sp.]
MTESYFETVEIGEQRETQARTVTETDVVNFAGVSGDFNHLHTDAESMADSAFGERIAHGMLVFSIATGLLWQSRSQKERDAVVAFYGIDEVRFVGPTLIGDTIHVEIEVLEKEPREHPVATGVVRYDIAVVTQDDDTVLSCEMLSLVT